MEGFPGLGIGVPNEPKACETKCVLCMIHKPAAFALLSSGIFSLLVVSVVYWRTIRSYLKGRSIPIDGGRSDITSLQSPQLTSIERSGNDEKVALRPIMPIVVQPTIIPPSPVGSPNSVNYPEPHIQENQYPRQYPFLMSVSPPQSQPMLPNQTISSPQNSTLKTRNPGIPDLTTHVSTGSVYYKQLMAGKKPVASISQYKKFKKHKKHKKTKKGKGEKADRTEK